MSLGSSSGSNDEALAVITAFKDAFNIESDDFGRILGTDVRLFIRNTRTSKDELRAVMRSFLRCTKYFNEALTDLGIVERVIGPTLYNSPNKDQLRSNARKMNQFFKSQTLENFLTICYPVYENHIAANQYGEAEIVIWAQKHAVEDCVRVVHGVLNDGFDCKTTSEDEE